MLAELREQKTLLDQLPELRKPFEKFLEGGRASKRWPFFLTWSEKSEFLWQREEVLNTRDGISFKLSVRTEWFHPSLSEAGMYIEVSSVDGRKVQEYLPATPSIHLLKRNFRDYAGLPARLEEQRTIVDQFLNPHITTGNTA